MEFVSSLSSMNYRRQRRRWMAKEVSILHATRFHRSLSREFGSRIDCRRWSNGWRRDGRTGGRRGCWSLEVAFWRLAVGEVAD
nr:hypothetical protein Iba_chr06cCG9970 [Ipomoea batatas]GME14087.1 hypothetical protein Iba_scaffold14933CG0010 [Ipomoea batatas]